MSSTARSYAPRLSRLRQSSSVSFHDRSGSRARRSKRLSCSCGETCSQNLMMIMPSSASMRSNSLISPYARDHCSSVAKPSTRSTSTRPYHDRSSTAIPPQPGSTGKKRHRKWWRFSSWVGAANDATRTWRGSSGATRRLIAPPLPEASQPSNSTHTGGPSRPSPSRPPSTSRSSSRRRCSFASRFSDSSLESFRLRSTSSRRPIARPILPGVASRRRAGVGFGRARVRGPLCRLLEPPGRAGDGGPRYGGHPLERPGPAGAGARDRRGTGVHAHELAGVPGPSLRGAEPAAPLGQRRSRGVGVADARHDDRSDRAARLCADRQEHDRGRRGPVDHARRQDRDVSRVLRPDGPVPAARHHAAAREPRRARHGGNAAAAGSFPASLMTTDFDVVVVGASTAGCTAARLLGQAGARVALVEKRPDMDAYKTVCTHYIQSSATPTIERLGLAPVLDERGAVHNSIDLWTPYSGWIRALEDSPYGYSITRQTLDPLFRRLAADTPGVDLMLGESA